MHIPKSAGTSIHAAIEAALPDGSLAPQRMDTSLFCDFDDFGLLREPVRNLIAVNDHEVRSMERYTAISGHFSLTTLLQVSTPSEIGTVLREPQARTLSLYFYWRTATIFDSVLPYKAHEYAVAPLARFMNEPCVAPVIDNQICRMLLHGDPRIPHDGFIAKRDIDALAYDAIAALDTLGFVGVLECEDDAWRGLTQLFSVHLERREINVTHRLGDPVPRNPEDGLLTPDALRLVAQRNAADRIVYEHALKRADARKKATAYRGEVPPK
ncbi:MAG TPA: hypothetical protein VHY18_03565 [Solirubrobacteraceae bacterium]|jgi:hypothetical protein|nr:hypothetical protein [Solirubrobacteraceae bacterium]